MQNIQTKLKGTIGDLNNEYNKQSEGSIFWNSISGIDETIKMVDPRFRAEELTISDKDFKAEKWQ